MKAPANFSFPWRTPPKQEDIRQLAFLLWMERWSKGGAARSAEDDWKTAEKMLWDYYHETKPKPK